MSTGDGRAGYRGSCVTPRKVESTERESRRGERGEERERESERGVLNCN